MNTECDDGNSNDGDGCSALCALELGFICSGGSTSLPDICQPILPLSIKSYTVSTDFSVNVVLTHYVNFNSVTLSDVSLTSTDFDGTAVFSPSMDTLSGRLSSFTFFLHPQSSIE